MNIHISNTSGKSLYEQIYAQIKNQILDGTLKEGEPLPTIRGLAKDLRISVITTSRAYSDLERDGYIYSVVGKGSFVAAKNKETVREEYLKQAESKIEEAIVLGRTAGLSDEELKEIFLLILKGD